MSPVGAGVTHPHPPVCECQPGKETFLLLPWWERTGMSQTEVSLEGQKLSLATPAVLWGKGVPGDLQGLFKHECLREGLGPS